MAKTLYLLRHAKSSWSDPAAADFARPLNPRGREAAPRMGGYLREQELLPELVLCSAARRAQETWELCAGELRQEVPVKVLRSLYLAPPSRLLAAVQRLPEPAGRVLMVGHNPGTEHLAERLAGPGSDPEALARLQVKYPTGALAELRFDVASWREVEPGLGKLIRFAAPKEI